MRRVRVPQLPCVVLDSATEHRLRNVLRLPPGTVLLAFDGQGGRQRVALTDTGLEPRGPIEQSPALPRLDLYLAVLKHSAMDLAVRMATEAGAHQIQPVFTERTVAKGDRHDRWARIASTAATQCGRDQEPMLLPARPLDEALPDAFGVLYVGMPGHAVPTDFEPGTLVIGPAGGLSAHEENRLLDHGARGIGLGPHILRAETAAAVGVATLLSRR